MNPISTETYPYSITYVCELLKTNEQHILSLSNQLGIKPHRDERTGRLFFSHPAVEAIRQALHSGPGGNPASAVATTNTATSVASKAGYASVPQKASMPRADLSVIVESVSNAKEEILKDLSQLLDDKLAGLDEVVVELIRSKSENDSLREELKRLEESRNQMEQELQKFKPAAFGFYRKEG